LIFLFDFSFTFFPSPSIFLSALAALFVCLDDGRFGLKKAILLVHLFSIS